MFFESFDIEVGDIVYAYRPIYNNSAEEFPEDKTVRRFLVLEKYDEEFLLISLTSKKKPVNAYQVGDSFARVNDLYLINKAFILNRLMKIDEDYMEFLLEKCVNCIKINDILYNDDIKEKVLALYKEKFCIPKFRKYEKYQIISLPNLEDSRYLIVDVSNDKYFLYRVKRDFNKSKWVYDFSNSLIFDKNCKYFLYKTLNKREIEDFLFEQKKYLAVLKYKNMKKNESCDDSIDIGTIVEYKNNMYFVLNKSRGRNHYSCILCDDYLFGDIITIDRRKINIVKKLSDDEIYDILSIVYRNLKLRNNETLYNKVYLKVRDYKENV